MKSWGAEAPHTTIAAVHQAAQVMDHPADLINVAIEDHVRQRFELPAFSTLDFVKDILTKIKPAI